jgi:predicted RNase H-like nuclease (RuvC/YqgF family)
MENKSLSKMNKLELYEECKRLKGGLDSMCEFQISDHQEIRKLREALEEAMNMVKKLDKYNTHLEKKIQNCKDELSK